MRNRIWRILKWILFRLDAETAHRLSFVGIRLGIRLGSWSLRLASGMKHYESSLTLPPSEAQRTWGIEFLSPVGLAAGFDKNAEILEALPSLGFGFAEIGTVTPLPQPGNDRPRLFRVPDEQSIFNRMGFNGDGAVAVSARLRKFREQNRLSTRFRVGVNIGKNKDTLPQDAYKDYVKAASHFCELSDYLVINVSSPNTPGLRELQTAEALKPIIVELKELILSWKTVPPLLLKLAPELKKPILAELMPQAEKWGIDGWVLTNTWGGEFETHNRTLAGGWSGRKLLMSARDRLLEARSVSTLPIISVGGILSEEEAKMRIQRGADLIQIYSGWIFQGPDFPVRIFRELSSIRKKS